MAVACFPPVHNAASAVSSPFLSSVSSSSSLVAFLPALRAFRKRPGSPIGLICKAAAHGTNRRSLAVSFTTLTLSVAGGVLLREPDANAAILEADDDEELLERVKKDRKKRLQRQELISSSKKETGYLQNLVYKLSKVGQAIDSNDFSTASSVLVPKTEAGWIQNVNSAFTKLSSGPEEKSEVNTFNASLAQLISAVQKNDLQSSKTAFVLSATALEKWTALSGLVSELKGL
ncbi:thylakoid lumenal 16.5 kDa protein, chloroplastic-like [Aristolochia californica]|uniref:thylakoid lumenal 16.5 kDa protein, chloroplastic-like n=1 Tax=Aristolochia californica TaxID=171875 RepID=UPI0035DB65BE